MFAGHNNMVKQGEKMTNIIIAGLLALIVMVQIFYLESLKRFRKLLLVLFTLILAACFYYFIGDPLEIMQGPLYQSKSKIASLWDNASLSSKGEQRVIEVIRKKVDKSNDKDYTQLYVEAFLAYTQQDYDIALFYFTKLYQLRPDDTSYYIAYANTLLFVDPRNPLASTLVEAVRTNPDRNANVWLLLGHYEEVMGRADQANIYYKKALKAIEQ